jgi:hypothetical protein
MSPEEVLKLKWKNVEIKNFGKINKAKRAEEVKDIPSKGIVDVYKKDTREDSVP